MELLLRKLVLLQRAIHIHTLLLLVKPLMTIMHNYMLLLMLMEQEMNYK